MLQVAAYRGNGLFHRIVKWWCGGPYSHIALVWNEFIVFEAHPRGGVRQINFNDTFSSGKTVDLYDIHGLTEEKEEKIVNFFRLQIGKGYNWPIILNFIFKFKDPQKVQNQRKESRCWICSEIVFAALRKGDVTLFDNVSPFLVDPVWLTRSRELRYNRTIKLSTTLSLN